MPHAFMHTCLTLGILLATCNHAAIAAEETTISLADGKIEMVAPADWKKVAPRVRIIQYEFSVPPAEGDVPGRVTIMGAGGSVEMNLKRWIGQFSATTKNETTKEKVAGQEVHVIDIVGTYADRRGPFAPAVERKGYRMLAAIIVTEKLGKYFVKFYGPEATVDKAAKAFHGMI
ncbi:MAG: hypothetical protein MI757_06180, partial [Pirellulales bacterium]|nr:hypothetical protein [Pirellulales bacterium]